MRKLLFIFFSLSVFAFHISHTGGMASLALAIVSLMIFIGATTTFVDVSRGAVRLFDLRLRKSQKMFQVLHSLSELSDEEFEKVLEKPLEFDADKLNQSASQIQGSTSGTILPFESPSSAKNVSKSVHNLHLVETETSNKNSKWSQLKYNPKGSNVLLMIKSHVTTLPTKDRKLILWLKATQPTEDEGFFIKLLRKNIFPDTFLKKNFYLKTDVLEISQETYKKNKIEIQQLEVLSADQYQHYVVFQPSQDAETRPRGNSPSI